MTRDPRELAALRPAFTETSTEYEKRGQLAERRATRAETVAAVLDQLRAAGIPAELSIVYEYGCRLAVIYLGEYSGS
jgi:hypothetical protein